MAPDKISAVVVHADTAPLDWADLYGRIPDEGLIVQFAASFVESTPQQIEALKRSLASKDNSRIECDAHALKGAAANLGAIRLAKAAWHLEEAARDQQGDAYGELFLRIQDEYAALMELLSHPDWIARLKHAVHA